MPITAALRAGCRLLPLTAMAVAAISAAPGATAQPSPGAQSCQTVPGGTYTGTGETECQSPGNVQINATAPEDPVYPYPWDDEFYGPALLIGGGDRR